MNRLPRRHMIAGLAAAAISLRDAPAKAQPRVVTPEQYGAVGDGRPHPLSERFATLDLAKRIYPFATRLDQQIDLCAWQAAVLAGGVVRARPGAQYCWIADDFWPRDTRGARRSGDPSGFDGVIVTEDARIAPAAAASITIEGRGCVIINGQLKLHHHRGGGHVSDIIFRDTLSREGDFPPEGGQERGVRRAVHYLFKWTGISGWRFTRCTWESPHLASDNDRAMGWIYSLPNQGFPNRDITFDQCVFDKRTEIDLWGGSNYAFLDCRKPHGGYDDGITAKTRGERDSRDYTGDVDGVTITGGEWHGCSGLFVAGSDMRWAVRRVRISNVILRGVGSVWLLKPDGKGSAAHSGGVVEDVVAENVTLHDERGERFRAAFRFATGERVAGQGGGTIRNCRARNISVVARHASQAKSRFVIEYTLFGNRGSIENIDLDLNYADPAGGAPHGRAPGYPMSALIGSLADTARVDKGRIANCRARIGLSGPAPDSRDPNWRVIRIAR